MNLIEAYLERKKIPRKKFASIIGVTEGALSHYITGRRTPKKDVAKKINRHTRIPLSKILFPDEKAA